MTAEQDQARLDRSLKYRIKRWRRANRARLNRYLARRYGTPRPQPAPLAAAPARILVCRLNSRLGNILFLTPLLTSLAATFPGVEIDVLVREAAHRRLLLGLPGIAKVHAPPVRPLLHPLTLLAFLRRLRRRRYDLVIDPVYDSVSNRVGVLLAGGRARLGFAGDTQWLSLDHAAARPAGERHQARQALHLLSDGITGITPVLSEHYAVAPDGNARAAAGRYWDSAFAQTPGDGPVVGFFAGATDAKNLGEAWWRQWLAAMRAGPEAPHLLQVLPPGDTPPLSQELPRVRIAALDELAALLARLDLFVSADAGPMHLAAAAGAPTIGLFRATDPRRYAPLGRDCLTLSGDQLIAEHVARRTREQLRALRAVA